MKALRKALTLFLVLAVACSMSLPAAAAIKYTKLKVYLNLKLSKDVLAVKVGKHFYISVNDFNKILPKAGIGYTTNNKYIAIYRKKDGGESVANIWMAFEPGTKNFYWNPDGKQIYKVKDHLDIAPFIIDKQYMINLGIICEAAGIPLNYDEKNNALHLGQKYVDKTIAEINKNLAELAKKIDAYKNKQAAEYKKYLAEYKKSQAEKAKAQSEADKKAALNRARDYTRSNWTKASTSTKWTIANEVAAYLTSTGTKVSSDDVYTAIELALDLSNSTSLLALAKIGLKF